MPTDRYVSADEEIAAGATVTFDDPRDALRWLAAFDEEEDAD